MPRLAQRHCIYLANEKNNKKKRMKSNRKPTVMGDL